MTGYLVRLSFRRFAEYNPAQRRWTADAGLVIHASVLAHDDAEALVQWFAEARGVDATIEPDPLERQIDAQFATQVTA